MTQMTEIPPTGAQSSSVVPRGPWTVGNRLIGVDPQRVRLWVAGQRLHHGATGVCLAGAAAARLLSRRRSARPLAWILAGGAMVAHDWKDRRVWFSRGPQS